MGFDYSIKFNLDDCLKNLGLNDRGRVQTVVTSEFMKNVEPYVPFDTGNLKNSAHIENGTEVVWNGPYARRLYYHPEYDFQGAPLRGAYWADRYLQDGGMKQLEDGARKAVGK